MVRKNSKTTRLEKALDQTLDRFLDQVKIEKEGIKREKENTGTVSSQGDFYSLSSEEEEKLDELASAQGIDKTLLIKKAVEEFLRRQQGLFFKENIKAELFAWQQKLEALSQGDGESDLSAKERKVLLSYIRQLARGTWEDR